MEFTAFLLNYKVVREVCPIKQGVSRVLRPNLLVLNKGAITSLSLFKPFSSNRDAGLNEASGLREPGSLDFGHFLGDLRAPGPDNSSRIRKFLEPLQVIKSRKSAQTQRNLPPN